MEKSERIVMIEFMLFIFLSYSLYTLIPLFFFFQAEDGIRDATVTGVQTCALPICAGRPARPGRRREEYRRGLQAESRLGDPYRGPGAPRMDPRARRRDRVARRDLLS